MIQRTMKIKMKRRLKRKIKKALALCLILSVSSILPAYATDNTADITDTTYNVDVDIAWGEMAFTYIPEHQIWNPKTHAYDAVVLAGWTAQGNDITVTNMGTRGVRADFSAAVNDAITTVEAGFKETADAESIEKTYSMELAGADKSTEPKGTVYLDFAGTISEDYAELATITITIIAE